MFLNKYQCLFLLSMKANHESKYATQIPDNQTLPVLKRPKNAK